MDTNSQLFIFKTDIAELCPNCEVYKLLNRHEGVQQWNIDTDDVDRVLRIESATLSALEIISIINSLGHECQELN
ncbi:hypothetical protein Q765_00785 [Flavobacterium rivuli WB 3.3-2 = DSM 21788]|uniref:HMA domain-containing protein n=1 Tax=Flavobacterium rivuli WB 3.3-2 = DSM 21788 TaxID=1121895 RepID=A0A0A2MJG4_9FLAO|nr:hypothetical protein [Flavobacterium rivuli]KGO88475.1 hypothetical protein Q765_00785 [Flavobacterium rivuli WB 3.3-2 = DSM 21788]